MTSDETQISAFLASLLMPLVLSWALSTGSFLTKEGFKKWACSEVGRLPDDIVINANGSLTTYKLFSDLWQW